MRHASVAAAAAVAAVVAALALAWALAPGGGSGPSPAAPLAASATIAPRSALFGDTLTATVRVVVDRSRVDAGSVRVRPDFGAYRASARTVSRTRSGRVERITVAYRLTCHDDGCLPRPGGFVFAPAGVEARARTGAAIGSDVAWPIVLVASRLTPEQRADPRFRSGAAELVPVDWAVEPGLVAALLTAAAVLAALLAAGIAVHVLRAIRPRAARPAPGPAASALELALAATRAEARAGGQPERRHALDALARALRRDGAAELAGAATRLAWSPRRPSPARVEAFADEVVVARRGRGG